MPPVLPPVMTETSASASLDARPSTSTSEQAMRDPARVPLTTALHELQSLLGDRLTTSPGVRARHGQDETYHPGAPPDAVAFPRSTGEASRIVEICALHRLPVI